MRKFYFIIGLLMPAMLFAQTLPKGMVNLTGDGIETTIDAKGNTAKKNMVVVGDKIFFTANDAVNGEELWITDGTVAGTKMVKDINSGTNGSDPKYLCAAGGKVYFSATTAANGTELWVSDGTEAGTQLASDIYVGAESSNPLNLTAMGETLDLVVFAAQDENSVLDNESWLYLYDCNAQKLKLLGKIEPMLAGDSYYGFLIPFKNTQVYFAAKSDTFGVELYKADTAALSARLVKDIMDIPAPGMPAGFTIGGNLQWIANYKDSLIVFRQTTPKKYSTTPGEFVEHIGEEIWFTDGVNVTFLGDLNAAKGADGNGLGTQYAWPITYNGKFYFRADDGTGTYVEIHTTNFKGLAGTTLVKDINPGAEPSWPQWWAEYKGALFLMASEGASGAGSELQYMTPTSGPSLFYDIAPGSGDSWLEQCTTVKTSEGKDTLMYFIAPHWDKELWVVTGLDKKAAPIGDMGPGSTNPFDLTGLNGALYFTTGTYKSLFKYIYEPVFNVSSTLISALDESKADTATFRVKFINPEGISSDAPYVNFSIAGDWKISLGGADAFANLKRLYRTDFQADLDTIVKVLVGTTDPEAWKQTLSVNCTFLNPESTLDTIKISAAWRTEPAYEDSLLFYVRIGDFSPATLDPKYEALGALQTKTDQFYQNDTLPDASIVKWGKSGDVGGQCWWDADRWTNFLWTNTLADNHLTYSFPLESGKYHLRFIISGQQWVQSRPLTFAYPGKSMDLDIQDQFIIMDTIINYAKGSDTTFNVSWTSKSGDYGLVVGGFMKIGLYKEPPVGLVDRSFMPVSVYPNPTRGLLHIRLNHEQPIVAVDVLDITGKSVNSKIIRSPEYNIDLTGCENGLYLVKVRTANKVETYKVILRK